MPLIIIIVIRQYHLSVVNYAIYIVGRKLL